MATITIPKKITPDEELVAIPKKEYELFLSLRTGKEMVTAEDVLRWSREAKELKKKGKLPLFRDLIKREYPGIAKKYNLK